MNKQYYLNCNNTKKGYSTGVKLCDLSNIIEEINENDQLKLNEDEFKNHNISTIDKIPDSLPSYQV